jgi:hypothetical protein
MYSARALPGLPKISAAFAAGELSFSKVRALTRAPEGTTEPPSYHTTQADALVRIAETALAHEPTAMSGGERYQVIVHVDHDTLPEDGPGLRSHLEDGPHGRVAPGGCPPGAPTDPDMQNSRIRLLGLRIRCAPVDAVHDPWGRQREAFEPEREAFPRHLPFVAAAMEPVAPPSFDLPDKAAQGAAVARHAEVGIVPAHLPYEGRVYCFAV